MRRTLKFLAVGMVVAVVGCGDNTPVGLDGPVFKKDRAGSPELNVVTYNVYVGAGLEFLLGVDDPMQIPIAAATVWAQVQATNFIERAQAIADQIAAADAHVVGLQEVSLFRRHEESGLPPTPDRRVGDSRFESRGGGGVNEHGHRTSHVSGR